MNTYTIDIRPRRQTTLPQPLLDALAVGIGDSVIATVKDQQIILTAKKQISLDAFAELQKIFKKSGISEEDMQQSARKIRGDVYEEQAKSLS